MLCYLTHHGAWSSFGPTEANYVMGKSPRTSILFAYSDNLIEGILFYLSVQYWLSGSRDASICYRRSWELGPETYPSCFERLVECGENELGCKGPWNVVFFFVCFQRLASKYRQQRDQIEPWCGWVCNEIGDLWDIKVGRPVTIE